MKLKKLNNKGFVLAETLVVTIFLMTIFTMIYTYFYPLIGEYEKRETYDDVDSTYSIFWIKRLIEDSSYSIKNNLARKNDFLRDGYFRFECRDIENDESKRETCINMVKALQVDGCDSNGNNCSIFITKYRIGGTGVSFKNTVKNNIERYWESCSAATKRECYQMYVFTYRPDVSSTEEWNQMANEEVFKSGFQEYVITLPDYASKSANGAKYRVTASFKHTKDNNNYYTYATTEVSK